MAKCYSKDIQLFQMHAFADDAIEPSFDPSVIDSTDMNLTMTRLSNVIDEVFVDVEEEDIQPKPKGQRCSIPVVRAVPSSSTLVRFRCSMPEEDIQPAPKRQRCCIPVVHEAPSSSTLVRVRCSIPVVRVAPSSSTPLRVPDVTASFRFDWGPPRPARRFLRV